MSPFSWDGRVPRYPADRASRYRDAGLWSLLPTAERFHQSAVAFPDREAVVDTRGRLTYAELDRRTDQIAAALHALGIRAHDPVIFQVTNRIECVLAWYGFLKAGAVPVATLAAHRGHEIGHISAQVGAVGHLVEAGLPSFDLVRFAQEQAQRQPAMRHIFTIGSAEPDGRRGVRRIEDLGAGLDPAAARATVESIQAVLDPEDVAVFQLSGGTTGVPKVIPRLHAEYWNSALCYARRLGRDEQSRTAHLGPLVHNAGVTCALHGVHAVGGCLVLPVPEPAAALSLMAAEQVSDAIFGHFMYLWVGTDGYLEAAKHLRTAVLSGAKVPPAVFDRIEELGTRPVQLFGMGEGLLTVSPADGPREARLACVGTVIAAEDEIRILDPASGEELPDGEIGELACRGSYTIPGYFDAAEHNLKAFTPDGFYRTGDLGKIARFGPERYLSIEGRIKDVINRGGEKINAEELELLLLRHPAVAEAAVVAMPDPRLGERTCAYLVAAGSPVDLAAVRGHLEALSVARFKWPERLEWVDAIPRTPVGKTDKKQLRADVSGKLAREAQAAAAG